jgi:hypothetical protein
MSEEIHVIRKEFKRIVKIYLFSNFFYLKEIIEVKG